MFVLPLYFQHIRHLPALTTVLALLPFAAVTVIWAVLVGRLAARVGPGPPMIAGQALAAAGSALLAAGAATTPYPGWPVGSFC